MRVAEKLDWEGLNLARYREARGTEFVSQDRQAFCPSPKAIRPTPTPIKSPDHANRGLFPLEKNGQGVKVSSCLHLVPRLRMCGALPPQPLRIHVVQLN
jgi:hypothetical protein